MGGSLGGGGGGGAKWYVGPPLKLGGGGLAPHPLPTPMDSRPIIFSLVINKPRMIRSLDLITTGYLD